MKIIKSLSIIGLLFCTFTGYTQQSAAVSPDKAQAKTGVMQDGQKESDPNIIPAEKRSDTYFGQKNAPLQSGQQSLPGEESVMINKNKDQVIIPPASAYANEPTSTDPVSPDYNPMINPDRINKKKSEL